VRPLLELEAEELELESDRRRERAARSRQEGRNRAAAEHLHRPACQLRRLDADPAAATFERVVTAAAEAGEGPEAWMRWREHRGRIGLDRFPGTAQDYLGDLIALALR